MIAAGEIFPIAELVTTSDKKIAVRGDTGFLHLHLARYSGCPICNYHFKKYSARLQEVKEQHIETVFVLHSTKDTIIENQGSMLWTTKLNFVADPNRHVYKAAGRTSALSFFRMFDRKTRAIGKSMLPYIKSVEMFGFFNGGLSQRPIDLLIDRRSGLVLATHVGEHLSDRWDVDMLLMTVVTSNSSKRISQGSTSSGLNS
ncbi:hypothetical protein HDV03_000528 [Kappamyces sp. JEL0829]|nr:hypothetical protein HDV03_000528 [Kappamyces sp. JEL0829]